jgi:hypothetical protein
MAGPMGYDDGVGGLRAPSQIDPYYYKIGPVTEVAKCSGGRGHNESSCWYCIVTEYEIPGTVIEGFPVMILKTAGCDWYRDGVGEAGRVHPGCAAFNDGCLMYNHSCW